MMPSDTKASDTKHAAAKTGIAKAHEPKVHEPKASDAKANAAGAQVAKAHEPKAGTPAPTEPKANEQASTEAKAGTPASDYELLLKRAYGALPEKTAGGERFEPPTVETFMQGSKTIIKNFDVICMKIRRDSIMLSKYFSRELAIPATIEGNRLILHGKFYDRSINEKLIAFINKYVICKECTRPDTKIVEGEHGVKMLVCDACGARSPVK